MTARHVQPASAMTVFLVLPASAQAAEPRRRGSVLNFQVGSPGGGAILFSEQVGLVNDLVGKFLDGNEVIH